MIKCNRCGHESLSFGIIGLKKYSSIIFNKYKGFVVALWPKGEEYECEFTMQCKKCMAVMGNFMLIPTIDMNSIELYEFHIPFGYILLSLYRKENE